MFMNLATPVTMDEPVSGTVVFDNTGEGGNHLCCCADGLAAAAGRPRGMERTEPALALSIAAPVSCWIDRTAWRMTGSPAQKDRPRCERRFRRIGCAMSFLLAEMDRASLSRSRALAFAILAPVRIP